MATTRRTTKRYRRALAGELVAEELTSGEREQLVSELLVRGYSHTQIAWHTRMTEYTVMRIRCRMAQRGNEGT